jgi:hypothetical protein
MSKALILVVPGMLASSAQTIDEMQSLATLAAYAGAPRVEPRGIAAAVLASLGATDATPVAPLALLGAGPDPGDDYILCADPIHLAVDRDTVVLVQAPDDLSRDDADALVRMLDRHFAGDDLRFDAVRPDAWFARRRLAPDLVTTPTDVARGRRLLASMPRGADAGTWKRWQNEIEMLLHEHAINSAREARGEAAVSGVWFWGGGRIGDVGAMPMTAVTAAPGRAGDLARGIARHTGGVAALLGAGERLAQAMARMPAAAQPDAPGFMLVALPARAEPARVESDWLAPAVDALHHHRLDEVQLIADGNGSAATWTARAPHLRQRILARIARRPFEIPAVPGA